MRIEGLHWRRGRFRGRLGRRLCHTEVDEAAEVCCGFVCSGLHRYGCGLIRHSFSNSREDAAGYDRRRSGASRAGGDDDGAGSGEGSGAPSLRHTRASGSSAGGWSLYPSGQTWPSLPSFPSWPAGPGSPWGPWGPGGPAGPSAPFTPFVPSSPAEPGSPSFPDFPSAPAFPDEPAFPGGPVGPGEPGSPSGPRGPRGPRVALPGSPRLPGGPATGFAPSCCTCRARASRAELAVCNSPPSCCTARMIHAMTAPSSRAPASAMASPRRQRRSSARSWERVTIPPPAAEE